MLLDLVPKGDNSSEVRLDIHIGLYKLQGPLDVPNHNVYSFGFESLHSRREGQGR